MLKELYNTPFDDAACPTPSGGDSTLADLTGGEDRTDMPKETPNMSELGPYINTVSVKDGPARNSAVAVEPGVASPAVAAGNIDQPGLSKRSSL